MATGTVPWRVPCFRVDKSQREVQKSEVHLWSGVGSGGHYRKVNGIIMRIPTI